MKMLRISAVLAAAVGGTVLTAPAAHAAVIEVPFKADSGDSCGYGSTEGILGWQYGFSPLPVTAVQVTGTVTDRPAISPGPGFPCRDDGFYTAAQFTAFSGTTAVGRGARQVNNGVARFNFTLSSIDSPGGLRQIDSVVVQVCRSPGLTLPPSYCGQPVVYKAPPIL